MGRPGEEGEGPGGAGGGGGGAASVGVGGLGEDGDAPLDGGGGLEQAGFRQANLTIGHSSPFFLPVIRGRQ